MRTKITTAKTPKMSDTPAPQLNGLKSKNVHSCPYVGLKSDSETSFSYASKSNYCHKVQPPEPVGISYQGSICLTEEYKSCPIYLQDWDDPLPADIRRKVSKQRRLPRLLFLLFLLLLLVAGSVWWFLGGFGNPIVFPSFGQSENTVVVSTQVSQVSDSPTPSQQTGIGFFGDEQTPTIVATNTPSMTLTSSATFSLPTPGPFAKTPFGPYERFLVHKVTSGESVSKIADMYNTTSEVIIAINRLVEDYYFFGETTPTSVSDLDGPYYSPTPTLPEGVNPTKTLPATATKPAIPTKTERVRSTKTLTPTPYETPNVWTTVLIHPDDTLVILPGVKDHETVDQYQAIYLHSVKKVEDLARLYGLTEDELRYYNGLQPGDVLLADRWLVVPFKSDGSPPTPVPTLMATIDFSLALTQKFGPQGEYVLHMVRVGENLPYIADLYHTTEEVLVQANEFDNLQPGDVLVVLPGRSNPQGIESFGTFLVEEDIPVGMLASQMKVFESDLVWYNGLEDDQVVEQGQWLIYPNPEPTPTNTREAPSTVTPGPPPTETMQIGPTSAPTSTPAPPTRTPHP